MTTDAILLESHGKVAIITLNIERKLNALNQAHYYRLAELLGEVAKRDDIHVTVLVGKGRFFSSGADTDILQTPACEDAGLYWLKNFLTTNIFVTRAFYTHPKILVTALNGPAVGLPAALIAFSDFIYAVPQSYILTPFTSLGLVAEGGASLALVKRLGIGKANEALIMSKCIPAEDLLRVGFVNKILDSENFLSLVLKEINEQLGDHLSGESMLKVKQLIRKPDMGILEQQNVAEVFGGLERLSTGIPQDRFQKINTRQIKHKL